MVPSRFIDEENDTATSQLPYKAIKQLSWNSTLQWANLCPWGYQAAYLSFRGLESLTIVVGTMAVGRHGTAAVAKRSHLDLSQEAERALNQNGTGLLKPHLRDTPPPTRPHLLPNPSQRVLPTGKQT